MRNLVKCLCIFIFLLTVLSVANADFLGQYGPGDVVVYSVTVLTILDARTNADSIFAWIFDPNDNGTPSERDTLEFRHSGHSDSVGFYWDSLTIPSSPVFGTWVIHIKIGVASALTHTTHHFQVMKMADDSLAEVLSVVVELLDSLQLWDDDVAEIGEILDTLQLWDDDIDDIIPAKDTTFAILESLTAWSSEMAKVDGIMDTVNLGYDSLKAWDDDFAYLVGIKDSVYALKDTVNLWDAAVAKIAGIQDTTYSLKDSLNTWTKWAGLTDIDSLEAQTQRLVDSTSAGTWSYAPTTTASITSLQDSLDKAMVAFYAQGMDSTTYKYYVNSSTQRYDSILTMNYAKTDTSTIMRYYFSSSGALDSVKVEKWR